MREWMGGIESQYMSKEAASKALDTFNANGGLKVAKDKPNPDDYILCASGWRVLAADMANPYPGRMIRALRPTTIADIYSQWMNNQRRLTNER